MSVYNIIAKTSVELSEKEWSEITDSFNTVFNKQFGREYLQNKYLKTASGFSIHGFLTYRDSIVGMFSVVPRLYNFNGTEKLVGLGCDAFILQNHRKDEFFLKDMADAAYEICRKNNINWLISIPNTIAYPYWKLYGNWKDIAELDYYVLPYRISKLLKTGKVFDCFSVMFFKAILYFSRFFPLKNKSCHDKKIDLKRDNDFIAQRYSDGNYRTYTIDGYGYFVVREYDEDGIRTVYLIDCHPLSKLMLAKALSQIMKDFKFDIILFVGKVDSSPFYFVKVPKSKVPRVQPFIGYLLTDELKDDFLSISSWNVSLANFDNR